MKNSCYFLICFLLIVRISKAQDQYLKIVNDCTNSDLQFAKVRAIDNRTDNQLLGYLQEKGHDGLTDIKFNGNLTDSLARIFTNQSSKNVENELVLILNELFVNGSGNMGKFKLSLRFFTSPDSKVYTELLGIDSVYVVRGKNSNEKLLRSVSEQFCEIGKRVSKENAGISKNMINYSLSDLYHLDSLEKLQIPMYLADKPAQGIYKDYAHFKMNTPDIDTEIVIDTTDRKGIQVDRIFKIKNRKVKLDPEGIYAVTDGKTLLKVTASGEYFEIKKRGLDFYYDRPGSFSSQEYPFSPYYFPGGGRIGTTMTGDMVIWLNKSPQVNTSFYRFKINHRKGNSVPVAVVEKSRK